MVMFTRQQAANIWKESVSRASQRQLWSTGLLVVSSAALGGIAVALWNRKSLVKMRAAEHETPEPAHDQLEFFDYE